MPVNAPKMVPRPPFMLMPPITKPANTVKTQPLPDCAATIGGAREQNAGERGQSASDDEGRPHKPVDANTGRPRCRRVSADGVERPADAREPSRQMPKANKNNEIQTEGWRSSHSVRGPGSPSISAARRRSGCEIPFGNPRKVISIPSVTIKP